MAEILQDTLNPRVTTRRVLRRHPNHQRAEVSLQSGTAAAGAHIRPLAGHQLAMLSKNGIGRDDGRDLSEHPTPKPMPQVSEATALSSKRSRRPSSRALRTRLSSRKNAMMLSCSCRSQPHSVAITNCKGNTSEVYVSDARSSFVLTPRGACSVVLALHRTSRMEVPLRDLGSAVLARSLGAALQQVLRLSARQRGLPFG